MPRIGLTTDAVVAAGAALIDREGSAALTVTRVAKEVGVKPPSLYNHVAGLDALERLIALDGISRLAEACRTAVMGRSGADALRAMAKAYRSFAESHPGLYPLTQVARPGDAEYEEKAARAIEPVLALLSGFGIPDADLIHAARTVRSALHGFAVLEGQSGFGLDVDLGTSFRWMVETIERGLIRSAPRGRGS